MSILDFTIPSDTKILKDIEDTNHNIKFIGSGSICQNIKETVYVRLVKFNSDDAVKKIVYKKRGISWGLKTIEVVDF